MRTYPEEQRQQAPLFSESSLSIGGCSVTQFKSDGQKKTGFIMETNQRKVLCNFLSRINDPQTSKKAGEKTKEFRARHIAKIWNCLKDNGSKTYKEIALLTGLEPVAVARRRKEMEENHLIEVLEETRNGCALWRAK